MTSNEDSGFDSVSIQLVWLEACHLMICTLASPTAPTS